MEEDRKQNATEFSYILQRQVNLMTIQKLFVYLVLFKIQHFSVCFI